MSEAAASLPDAASSRQQPRTEASVDSSSSRNKKRPKAKPKPQDAGSSSSSAESDDRDSNSSGHSTSNSSRTRRRSKTRTKKNDTKDSRRRYDSREDAGPPFVPGEFRYLKPDEIQSGLLPVYDFAVIVNRSVKLPGFFKRALCCVCCCGASALPPSAGTPRRGCMDAISDTSHERSGFRRLCMANSPMLSESEDEHRRIVDKLCSQGLLVDIIDGGDSKGEMHSGYLILLVRAPDVVVQSLVKRFRTQMWMEHGAVVDMEQDVAQRRDDPTTPAERIEIVDYIIEQRARLSKRDLWIHDLFPMHNQSVTDTLIHRWVTSWRLLELDDKKVLSSLRYNFGEKVTYYFAFLKYYNSWLIPLAAIGILLELSRGVISVTTYMRLLPFWGLGVSVIWGFGFLKSWERENACMQFEWTGKLHVKQIEYRNKLFHGESRVNAMTGEVEVVYPAWRRLPKYFCVFLFMLAQMLIMLVLVASWVTIYEILKATYKESYIFSTQWLLILLEGCIFGFFVDVVQWNMVVTKMGALFTHWENYRTEEQYEKALVRKLFLLDFLNYYTWFFSLAFIFVIPGLGNYLTNTFNHMFFGDEINCCFGPYVDQDGSCTICPVGDKDATCIECVGFFTFDRRHVDLSAMFVTPIVITQSLNILLRLVAPILVRKRREKAQAHADARAQKRVREAGSMRIIGALDYEDHKPSQFGNKSSARYLEYTPSEIEVLNKKAREIIFDSEQDTFDPYDDFHVLTVQFGFTVMFSMLWPLMPFACFLINSVKGRTDGYRLCKTLKRPIPRRANGIGAWKGILTTFAYISVIVNVLLICISTGVLEFFDETCVRDIEHELEKHGKTLDDFIFGPDFGCLHFAWRLLFILVLEHSLVAVAYVAMQRVPQVPSWIKDVMSARENKFKELLREHELDLFPPNSSSSVDGSNISSSKAMKLNAESTPSSDSHRIDIKRLVGFGGSTTSMTSRSTRATHSLSSTSTSSSSAIPPSISIDPMTPLSRAPNDLEFPNSSGVRSKAREKLARQWSDGST
ncbi:hypothetical protein PHYBOEH_000395 [Phytophthora boehmeriae]|uniref:Anoctamin transmembrane domain-containing protein n=1 Tax=Phytophthora boehmeriae TaxID=109152 RepID=A0A8T1WW20_9STRA|nr:hypothetical protein PHYBOEH_000395 [Phytophthora boehmeriae]